MRRASLEQDRATYRIARKYEAGDFPGIAVAAEVPPEEQFDLAFVWRQRLVDLRLLLNQRRVDFERATHDPVQGEGAKFREILGLMRQVGAQHVMFRTPLNAVSRISRSFPANLSGYLELFCLMKQPPVVPRVTGPMDAWNRTFAWERLAGANPMLLRRIRSIPGSSARESQHRVIAKAIEDHPELEWEILTGRATGLAGAAADDELPGWFDVSEDQYRSVMGGGDSLARAAAEGRLFIADYRDCAALPRAQWNSGILDVSNDRYLYAPMALFAWRPSTASEPGRLVAVAVQCAQVGPHAKVFTPKDGTRWKMACTVVQSADANVQEMVYHLPRTHVVMEAAVLSARRHLAANHPLRILLEPHFRYTLAINDYAVHHLIAPGGQVERLLGSTLSGSLTMLARSLSDFDFASLTPDRDVVSRGVEQSDGLPDYPWRDDALLVWDALRRFVDGYVRLYYADDATVCRDGELRGFVSAFGDRDAGAIRGVPCVEDIDGLTWLIAAIVWTATCAHSALNYAQFPGGGFVPNAPGALYAEAPTEKTVDTEERWMAMLPPMHQALLQFNILYQLSSIQVTRLGRYPWGWFEDRRVRTLLRAFRRDLDRAESEILARDAARFLPYPHLRPSRTGQSVFI